MDLIDQVKISSRLEDISVVESKVEDLKDELEIEDSKYGNMMLAVVEAVTNAIQHGNRYAPEKEVTLETYRDNHELRFIVTDEGEGFDPSGVPDPTLPENVEKPCGRGVFLIKNLADDVEYHDNGRKIEINFRISE